MGNGLRRSRGGNRHPRSVASPQPRRHYPRRQLPFEGKAPQWASAKAPCSRWKIGETRVSLRLTQAAHSLRRYRRRARSRLASHPQPEGVSSSCRQGVDSGCRLTDAMSSDALGILRVLYQCANRCGFLHGRCASRNGPSGLTAETYTSGNARSSQRFIAASGATGKKPLPFPVVPLRLDRIGGEVMAL